MSDKRKFFIESSYARPLIVVLLGMVAIVAIFCWIVWLGLSGYGIISP